MIGRSRFGGVLLLALSAGGIWFACGVLEPESGADQRTNSVAVSGTVWIESEAASGVQVRLERSNVGREWPYPEEAYTTLDATTTDAYGAYRVEARVYGQACGRLVLSIEFEGSWLRWGIVDCGEINFDVVL